MTKEILIFDISFLTGNNRTPVISKITNWQKKGVIVGIFCTKEAKEHYERKLKNIHYVVLPYAVSPTNRLILILENLKRNFIALFYVPKILKKHYFGIYSLSAVLDLVLFPYLLKLLTPSLRWFVVFDNTVEKGEPGNPLIKYLAYLFYRVSLSFLKGADRIFVVTTLLQKALIKEGLSPDRLTLTGNGVEATLIKKSGRLNKIYDGLFVGRINESKGVYDLLKSLKIIVRNYPKFKLALMGRGDDLSEKLFMSTVKKLGLQKNIALLGFKSGLEKIEVFKRSKVFIFLSPSESFGVALLEAVCCGLPAVAYELKPFKYIYKNKEVRTVKVGDYEQAAKEVINIFQSGKFINNSGEKLINKYNWDTIAETELKTFI